jgi:hypothetical protein
MVIKSLSPLLHEKEQEHVLITEYLTGTNKITPDTKVEEHNVIAVSPNDHRWYRSVNIDKKKPLFKIYKFDLD